MAKKVPPPIPRPTMAGVGAARSSNPATQDGNQQATQSEDRTTQAGTSNGAIPRTPRQPRSDPNSIPNSPFVQTGFFDFTNLVSSSQDSAEATALEGQELYLHFVHEQLRQAHLGDYADQEEARLSEYHISGAHCDDNAAELDGSSTRRRPRTRSMNLENFQNPVWRDTGRELQVLADAFARSNERLMVRERAAQVDVFTIDKDKFFAMMAELFQGGRVTRERILVLFFFCSDVAIFAVRSRISGLLAQLTRWSIMFIREQVCAWVHQNGGWSSVLRSGLNFVQQAAVIGMCAAVITCCVIYIRKNLN